MLEGCKSQSLFMFQRWFQHFSYTRVFKLTSSGQPPSLGIDTVWQMGAPPPHSCPPRYEEEKGRKGKLEHMPHPSSSMP